MKFFDIYPENFFSVFTSPNKKIYVEALFVLRRCYQQSTLVTKDELLSSLVANLENQIFELEAEDGVLGLEDNLSGRAHFLIRKFLDTGWLEREQDPQSFDEQYIIPVYASKLLNLLYAVVTGKVTEYNGFVYSTYSILKTADEDRDEYMYDGLRQACQLTETLQDSLRELLHNLRFYYQRLQEQDEVKEILAEHFDMFRLKISDKIYHPLKTFDSVPRFKNRILKILKDWLTNPQLIDNMVEAALKRGYENDADVCRQTVIIMLNEIMETYRNIDHILRAIDKKNSAYTRASVERIQYFLNTDRDSRGKLVEILKRLPRLTEKNESEELLDILTGDLPLFQQGYLDEESLYKEPKRRKEHKPRTANLESQINEADLLAEMDEFKERLQKVFSHQKVLDYIMQQLKAKKVVQAGELDLEQDEDFIKLILAVIKAGEADIPYSVRFKDNYIEVNGYRLPDMLISKKGADTF